MRLINRECWECGRLAWWPIFRLETCRDCGEDFCEDHIDDGLCRRCGVWKRLARRTYHVHMEIAKAALFGD